MLAQKDITEMIKSTGSKNRIASSLFKLQVLFLDQWKALQLIKLRKKITRVICSVFRLIVITGSYIIFAFWHEHIHLQVVFEMSGNKQIELYLNGSTHMLFLINGLSLHLCKYLQIFLEKLRSLQSY